MSRPFFLITFEGVDNSGKSAVSKCLTEMLNTPNFPLGDDDSVWELTKEPTFSSAEADALNLRNMDSYQREVSFLIDRIKHQSFLKSTKSNMVCDRYIWSGFAYAKVFGPEVLPFIVATYSHPFFIKPDAYVFMDTPIDICLDRGNSFKRDKLEALRSAYLDGSIMEHIKSHSKILFISSVGGIEETAKSVYEGLKELLSNNFQVLDKR